MYLQELWGLFRKFWGFLGLMCGFYTVSWRFAGGNHHIDVPALRPLIVLSCGCCTFERGGLKEVLTHSRARYGSSRHSQGSARYLASLRSKPREILSLMWATYRAVMIAVKTSIV